MKCLKERQIRMRYVLATQNPGKVLEMRTILSDVNVEIVTLQDLGIVMSDIIEDGETFEENSFIKAKAVMDVTGLPAIADDSGLCVNVLDDGPGIYSARYGGASATDDAARNALVLQALQGQNDRRAKFVCVVTCCFPVGVALATRGECHGLISYSSKGAEGFGYDSIFQPEGETRTFAEMSGEEKNILSHRGKALREFRRGLQQYLATHQGGNTLG